MGNLALGVDAGIRAGRADDGDGVADDPPDVLSEDALNGSELTRLRACAFPSCAGDLYLPAKVIGATIGEVELVADGRFQGQRIVPRCTLRR